MRLNFSDIIGRHKGAPALVIGHGPSLNNYINMLPFYRSKGVILFGCNEWFRIYLNAPNYVVYASNMDTLGAYVDVINSNADKLFVIYADSVDLVDRSWVETNIKCDYIGYDQKHFDSRPCCDRNCCKHIIPGRLTIQEELQKFTGHTCHYGSGDTVAVHMLASAILMGCNPIYIVGVELSYDVGYANNSGNLISKVRIAELSDYSERICSDFEKIRDSAKRIGTRIINLNKQSKFDVFETGDLCV
jgi:hypothetical protein